MGLLKRLFGKKRAKRRARRDPAITRKMQDAIDRFRSTGGVYAALEIVNEAERAGMKIPRGDTIHQAETILRKLGQPKRRHATEHIPTRLGLYRRDSSRDTARKGVTTGLHHLNRAEIATERGESPASHLRQAAEAWEVGADAAEEKGAHRQARALRRMASAARNGSVRRAQNLYHKHERELMTSAAPSRETFETTINMGPRGEPIPARVSYHPKMAILKAGKLQGRGGWSVTILGKSRTGFLPGQSGRTAQEAIRNTETFARRVHERSTSSDPGKRKTSKRGTWIGSFGYAWSPVRQRWMVLYSPKHDIGTASVIGSYETKEEAMRVAKGTSADPGRRRATRRARRR